MTVKKLARIKGRLVDSGQPEGHKTLKWFMTWVRAYYQLPGELFPYHKGEKLVDLDVKLGDILAQGDTLVLRFDRKMIAAGGFGLGGVAEGEGGIGYGGHGGGGGDSVKGLKGRPWDGGAAKGNTGIGWTGMGGLAVGAANVLVTGGSGGDVDISWDNLKFLKKKVGGVDIAGGKGGDAFIRGLNAVAEKEGAKENEEKKAAEN